MAVESFAFVEIHVKIESHKKLLANRSLRTVSRRRFEGNVLNALEDHEEEKVSKALRAGHDLVDASQTRVAPKKGELAVEEDFEAFSLGEKECAETGNMKRDGVLFTGLQ